MREQFFANVAIDLKFYRRNKLLLAIAILFLFISLLFVGGSLLFGSASGRFELLRTLFWQLDSFALIFTAGLGLFLVSSQVRAKNVKLVFTKPCSPEVWLGAGYASALMVSFILYAAVYLLTLALSFAWGVTPQPGFAFIAIHHFLMAATVLSYLMLLTVATHPVIAVLITILLNEEMFTMIRTGLLAAIRNTGGSFLLPVLEKITFAIYLVLPMYSPYPDSIERVASSMRVDGGEWWTLLSTLGYVSAILAMSYLLSLMLLRRKNYM